MAERDERSQGRAEEETQRRRRRGNEGQATARRLPIPPEVQARLKAQGLVPRWVNDEGNRMHRFTKLDDYEPVEGVEPVPVGTDQAGQPILAHLLAKRSDFIREDREEAEGRRKETEEALFRKADAAVNAGAGANPANPTQAPSSTSYVAEGSKLGRGNQVLD